MDFTWELSGILLGRLYQSIKVDTNHIFHDFSFSEVDTIVRLSLF